MKKKFRNRFVRNNSRITRMRLCMLYAVMLSAALLALQSIGPVFAEASTVTTNSKFDINGFTFVPCADGGAGEVVELSGSLHNLFHATDTGNGKFIVHFQFNPQGLSGTGLNSGDKYQGTGVTLGTIILDTGVTETFVNNFRIIGQGDGNNLLAHENLHIAVDQDGTVASFHDNLSVTCE